MQLTENNGDVWESLNQLVLHLVGDFWNLGVLLLVNQPSEQFFFLHQVALVNVGDATLEQHHSWQVLDTPLGSFVVVVNLHKSDVILVAFVVDVFKLRQNLLRFLRVLVVCK